MTAECWSGQYGDEEATIEAWLDEHSAFVHDYFTRKATRTMVDSWLLSHSGGGNCPGERPGSGAATPVRKISAHEFERVVKPLVTRVDGTPTFLSVPADSEEPLRSGPRTDLSGLEERELLFELVKDICNDLDVRSLCHKILQNVSTLLRADRGSLFLVQGGTRAGSSGSAFRPVGCLPASANSPASQGCHYSCSRCLVSKLFDVCSRSTLEEVENREEIRVPWGTGIIGHVAETGQPLNIPDAYKDERFNQEVDARTGYRTKSLLCMPIKDLHGEVIGVAQVINKEGELPFTENDEKVFSSYLQFCGIGLRNAQLYEKSQLEVKRNQVLLDLARMIFEEQSTIEHMVFRILTHTQSLIQCQRVQVLLLHKPNMGSFSRVFDFEANDLSERDHEERTR